MFAFASDSYGQATLGLDRGFARRIILMGNVFLCVFKVELLVLTAFNYAFVDKVVFVVIL